MKIVKALMGKMAKKDVVVVERLEYSRVQSAILGYCEEYLHAPGDILEIEALPSAIDATLSALENPNFLDQYEFQQVSESLFQIRARELEL